MGSEVKTRPELFRGKNWVAAVLVAFAVGILGYWISFFTSGEVHAAKDACYLVFQRNFPAPDGATALFGVISAVGLVRNKDWAVLWGLVAAGGILFLGLIDISYNVWNGMYSSFSAAMLAENMINIVCMTLGPFLIYFLWSNRRKLEAA
ncbi:hypothetical protein [Mycobacteroides immunogenum]|uniref:hypothetical protein n=1 Tax=Mycobacteroides immunogenum TaxID=83262 RepID=UPI000B197867|nr:hypothetical protein [Mycobacteroides immunogenum]